MIELFSQPETWVALAVLIVMEVVLGIDNLIFISIATSELPLERRRTAQRVGISLALVLRLLLLSALVWLVGLTKTVFDLGITGPLGEHGIPTYETAFSWRDLIMISGGLFLIWKSTTEIRHKVDPEPASSVYTPLTSQRFASIIVQIILLDVVFSIDSILTAIGMTNALPVMVIAVLVAVSAMYFLAEPMAKFVNNNPTVVMLALAFLLTIGALLVAEGFGRHIPRGYVYAAIGFAASVEGLNILSRRRKPLAEATEPVFVKPNP